MLKNYSKIEVDHRGTKHYLNQKRKFHRLDGPAVEYSDGSKYWLINGNYHQNIGHSIECRNGPKYWLFKGKHHRIGGSYHSYDDLWFIYGKEYSKKGYINIVWDI